MQIHSCHFRSENAVSITWYIIKNKASRGKANHYFNMCYQGGSFLKKFHTFHLYPKKEFAKMSVWYFSLLGKSEEQYYAIVLTYYTDFNYNVS